MHKKKILAINGSASENSSNLAILKVVQTMVPVHVEVEIYDDLHTLPHFRTALTELNVPKSVDQLRQKIRLADGVIFCTPEYIFSIPSAVKNAIEWCVSTTVFSDKPVGIITASASGVKGHEELKMIMTTVQAKVLDEVTLLIQGVKAKVAADGTIVSDVTRQALSGFANAMMRVIEGERTG